MTRLVEPILTCLDAGWLEGHPEFEAQMRERALWERARVKLRRVAGGRAVDRGHPYEPGSGPRGETCGSCAKCVRKPHGGNRTYFKCNVMRGWWTGGRGTDIRAKDAACLAWEPVVEVIRAGFRVR